MEAYEGADWVRISDEVPVDEDGRDRCSRPSRPTTTPARPARSPRPRSSRATTSSTRTRTARTRAARTERPCSRPSGQDGARLHPARPGRQQGHALGPKGETVVLYFYPRADTPGLHDPGLRHPRPLRRVRGSRRPRDRRLPGRAGGAEEVRRASTTSASPCSPTPTTRSPTPTAPGARSRCTARSTWACCASTFIIDPKGKIAGVFPKVQPKKHDALVLEGSGGTSSWAGPRWDSPARTAGRLGESTGDPCRQVALRR